MFSLILIILVQIVTLSDLECDYINARSCCTKLNRVCDVTEFIPSLCTVSSVLI